MFFLKNVREREGEREGIASIQRGSSRMGSLKAIAAIHKYIRQVVHSRTASDLLSRNDVYYSTINSSTSSCYHTIRRYLVLLKKQSFAIRQLIAVTRKYSHHPSMHHDT